MGGINAFEVAGRVTGVLANGTWQVELSNGHRLTGFVAGRDKKIFAGANTGDTVRLQLTPYDLSVGRILVETKKI
jgi:translation initiation factor IF-1